MRRLVLLVPLTMLAGFLLTITTPSPAAACLCVMSTKQEKLAAADVVVKASVASVGINSIGLEVTRVYRGTAEPKVIAERQLACDLGVPINEGDERVWFLSQQRGRLETIPCFDPVPAVANDRLLGVGTAPEVDSADSSEGADSAESAEVPDQSSSLWLVGGGAGLAALAALAFVVLRRRRGA